MMLLVILCCFGQQSEARSVVDTIAQTPVPATPSVSPREGVPIGSKPAQEKAPEALVLGLRAADGSLQTLFVDAQGIQILGSGVAVPRRSGWWKLGLSQRTANKGQYKDVTLWAAPAGKKPVLKGLGDVAGCENDTTVTVLFVGSDWVSSEISSGGYCEGAAHPYAIDVLASPSGRVVVLVTKRGLTLHVDGKTVAEHPASGSAAVLTQWAVGAKNVERWRKEAAKALKL